MRIRANTRPLVSIIAAMIVITTAAVAAAADVHIYMTARMMGSMTLSDGRNVATWGFRLGSGMGGAPQVPGPVLQVNQGDHVYIHFRNFSPMDHTIHLHGLDVDQANDGVPQTSFAVSMMGSYTYEFIAPHAGSYNYHCHVDTILHLQMGMYGAINVLPPDGSNHAWDGGPAFDLERTWITAELDLIWNQQQTAADFTIYEPDYFLVNGQDGEVSSFTSASNSSAATKASSISRVSSSGAALGSETSSRSTIVSRDWAIVICSVSGNLASPSASRF
jgi:FtsP/CotA-like multicopper oxidase with cupredoxin domain